MLRTLAPGALAGGVLLLLVGGALWGLLRVPAAGGLAALAALAEDRYVWQVLRFTVWQAALSTLLSLALAVPVARALARRQRFPGRALLLRLFGLPMVVPTVVGVLGIVAVYGRSGLLNRASEAAGLPLGLDIYGLFGILLAHVFFNMPFAVRLLVQGWGSIPGESWRLAAQLGMTGPQMLRWIEAPMLRRQLPGIAGLIFMLCFTSFSVVLVLGGGPPNATLEVAIYQALRFEFDVPRVVALAALQIAVCAVLVGLMQLLGKPLPVDLTLARLVDRHDRAAWGGRLIDGLAIAVGAVLLLAPLSAVAWAALTGPLAATLAEPELWRAAGRSLAVGLTAGTLALLLGWGVLLSSRELRTRHRRPAAAEALELSGALVLVIPPFVLGAGLFVLLRPVADVFALGLVLVVLVNALMGLPFVVRVLGPAAGEAHERHLRLCDSLGMTGWQRFRLVDWPLLRRPAGLALALASTLALGDFGVIALFGTAETRTLPLYLFHLMGSYRMGEAAVTALLLVALCLALFLILERGVGGRGDPRT